MSGSARCQLFLKMRSWNHCSVRRRRNSSCEDLSKHDASIPSLISELAVEADLVVASAGEDRKISMWMKNGQSVGIVPQPGADADDTIDVSALFCPP